MPHCESSRRDAVLQAVRYLTVAGSVAVFYLLLFGFGLALGWHYFLAILTAQAITIAVAFPVYRTFVFHSTGTIRRDFTRFLAVWVSGAIAGVLVTPLLVEVLRIHPFIAQVVSICAVSIGSFLLHRFFSFRPTRPETAPLREDHFPQEKGTQ